MTLSVSHWLSAARPKTLPLALTSIVTGSCLAYTHQQFSWSVSILALLTATLLQILSNLANDYGDAQQGTDNQDRLGPTRAIQSGEITAKQMKSAMVMCSLLSLAAGLTLILTSLTTMVDIGIFLGLGVLAIFCAIAYTVGKKPYGYIGLGDLSVYIFFGLLGVGGTFYLHTNAISADLFLPATATGLLAVAVLNVNNMRDIDNDRAFGKTTMAVRMGLAKAKHYHALLVLSAWLAYFIFVLNNHVSFISLLLTSLILVPSLLHLRSLNRATDSLAIAPLMAGVVKLALIANLLFSLAIIV
ncbi:1,4-dihydroxy-2-naphthoate polyprenyltransferase [Vibrio breoganii]|uniref:1,4-dihydroxy-2-naphthoate polyprenyltransferase n=1 Tax=Vibrio breoganii TaxID=553239 RepID=UPI000C83AC05|nr:1,4-dihydroxy-2-naphthoate polyprenyltransferase [Vibrio breoganii]